MSNRDTRLVIEEDTVYELDLACLRNRKRKKRCARRGKRKGSGERKNSAPDI